MCGAPLTCRLRVTFAGGVRQPVHELRAWQSNDADICGGDGSIRVGGDDGGNSNIRVGDGHGSNRVGVGNRSIRVGIGDGSIRVGVALRMALNPSEVSITCASLVASIATEKLRETSKEEGVVGINGIIDDVELEDSERLTGSVRVWMALDMQ